MVNISDTQLHSGIIYAWLVLRNDLWWFISSSRLQVVSLSFWIVCLLRLFELSQTGMESFSLQLRSTLMNMNETECSEDEKRLSIHYVYVSVCVCIFNSILNQTAPRKLSIQTQEWDAFFPLFWEAFNIFKCRLTCTTVLIEPASKS